MADRSVDVLVVGAGPAGHACASTLRNEGFEGSVLVAGRDLDPSYERPYCSKEYLRGAKTRQETYLAPLEGVELHTRCSVMKLDAAERVAKLSTGEEVGFERGLLATGANVRRLRVDGCELQGIHYLRTLGNSDAIREEASEARRAVLVGGSFIACEVAASLTVMGVECTLVMLEEAPFANVFGPEAGAYFASLLQGHGIELVTGDSLAGFEGSGEGEDARVERVRCESGRVLDADTVVVGAGVMPDVMLARACGLELGDSGGVSCSPSLETSAARIWAAGDICEYDSVIHGRRLRVEHWEHAVAQGKHVARAMLGSDAPYTEVPYFWSDLADWATLESVGPAASWDRTVVAGSLDAGKFTIFYVDGDRLAGAMTVGRSSDLDVARRLLVEGGDVDAALAELS